MVNEDVSIPKHIERRLEGSGGRRGVEEVGGIHVEEDVPVSLEHGGYYVGAPCALRIGYYEFTLEGALCISGVEDLDLTLSEHGEELVALKLVDGGGAYLASPLVEVVV